MRQVESVTGSTLCSAPMRYGPDMAQTLEHLLKVSVELLGADKGILQLQDETGKFVKIFTHGGSARNATGPPEFDLATCPVSNAALRSQQQVIVENVSTDLTFKPFAPLYAAHGIAAVQSKPLCGSQGNVIGVISTHFARPHRPSATELRFLDLCADEALRVIAHEQTERQIRSATEQLEQRNAELEQLNAKLTRSNQDLERFALAASHDLREPLRVITTYSQLLVQKCRESPNDDSASFVGNIVQCARRMSDLVGDLLAYAEIRACAEEDSAEAVDLNGVVHKVTQNLRICIDETGASITSENLPAVFAPEFHLIQLFQNLIGNAIQYRSELKPQIHVSAQMKDGQLEISVADNGSGIDPKYHDRIFLAFKRLHGSESPGTGIGLSICQGVVERYGGRIFVESRKGDGATFRFTLPKIAVRSAAATRLFEGTSDGRARVLLVEDHPADISLFRLSLNAAELDYELTVIHEGAEALTFVRQEGKYANSGAPDMTILDFDLPKIDVIEILEAMTNNPELTNVPVIVISSGLSPRELTTVRRFRCATYLRKPSSLEDFLKIGLTVKELLVDGRKAARPVPIVST